MSISALKLFCLWNSLRRMLRPTSSGRKAVTDTSKPNCPSRRKTKRVFLEMP